MKEGTKIRQFQYENEAAQRLLEFLLQENAVLKTRLAGVLQETNVPGDILDKAEQYHECLLQKDEVICFMRRESAELERILSQLIHEDGNMRAIAQEQMKIRKDLKELVAAFTDLKARFNVFLESVL